LALEGNAMTMIEQFQTLPPELQREVEDFIAFLLAKHRRLQQPAPDDAGYWQAASQPALDAVWDHDEDAVYADLLTQ
jgi:hypothetical protein